MTTRRPYIPPGPWSDPCDRCNHYGRDPIRLEHGPLEVNFAGFRSDTYALQQHGWEIAERRVNGYGDYNDYPDDRWQISIRHPTLGVSGRSRSVRELRQSYRQDGCQTVVIEMDLGLPYMVTDDVRLQRDWFPVDATPYCTEIQNPVDLFDMPYFRPIEEGKDIFLKKASVEEIMQIALDKQEPEQAEIRARRRQEQQRAEFRRGGTTAAKLIMVA